MATDEGSAESAPNPLSPTATSNHVQDTPDSNEQAISMVMSTGGFDDLTVMPVTAEFPSSMHDLEELGAQDWQLDSNIGFADFDMDFDSLTDFNTGPCHPSRLTPKAGQSIDQSTWSSVGVFDGVFNASLMSHGMATTHSHSPQGPIPRDGISNPTATPQHNVPELSTSKISSWGAKPPSHPHQPATIPMCDRLYMAHLKVDLMNRLPVRVRSLWKMIMDSSAVRYAAMAWAAADLANRQGSFSNDKQGRWIAQAGHSEKACTYATKCSESMAKRDEACLETRLVVSFLEITYQFEAGSVDDMWRALKAVDAIFLSQGDSALSLPEGRSLAQNWLHFRAYMTIFYRPHAPLGKETKAQDLFDQLEDEVADSALLVSSIGSKASRIGKRILVGSCLRGTGESAVETVRRMEDWWNILTSGFDNGEADGDPLNPVFEEEDLYAELAQLRSTLESCTAPDGICLENCLREPGGDIEPLKFSSHSQAMACADYVFAQLACNESALRALTANCRRKEGDLRAPNLAGIRVHDPWVHLLYRIAAGLDPAECQQNNTYRQGITSMLFNTVFLGANVAALQNAGQFLQRAMSAEIAYEGPFAPIWNMKTYTDTVLRELSTRPGRTVFMASSTYLPSSEREQLFSKGTAEHVFMCGRESDGRYFTTLVPMYSSDNG